MQRKLLVIFLMVLIALFAFSACKSGNKSKDKADNSASQSEEVGNGDEQKKEDATGEDATDKSGAKSGSSAGDKSSGGSGSSGEGGSAAGDSGSSGSGKKNTDGWEEQKNGRYEKGDVSVNVVKYGNTTVDEGEQLIEELVKGGLSKAKKLSADKSDSTVTYEYSGKRIGQEEIEYIKFEFIVEGGKGYLVTVIAQKQGDLDTDISYITSHLAEVAI